MTPAGIPRYRRNSTLEFWKKYSHILYILFFHIRWGSFSPTRTGGHHNFSEKTEVDLRRLGNITLIHYHTINKATGRSGKRTLGSHK